MLSIDANVDPSNQVKGGAADPVGGTAAADPAGAMKLTSGAAAMVAIVAAYFSS